MRALVLETVVTGSFLFLTNTRIFTHHINLLTETFEFSTTPQSKLNPEQSELLALQANVKNVVRLHPIATFRFLTDDDCVDSIRRMYRHNSTTADVRYFLQERIGMFKADLCRCVALY